MKLPPGIWDRAIKQARRSNMKTFRTGAVVFDKHGRVLGQGCSFHGDGPRERTHAEQHALSRMWPALPELRAKVLVVTLGKAGNFTYSSRPCGFCVNMLRHFNIESVIYPHLQGEKHILVEESIEDLYEAIECDITAQRAKLMRVHL